LLAHRHALALAVGTAPVAILIVPVVAFLWWLHDAITAMLRRAVSTATVEVEVVPIIAFLWRLHDTITASLDCAVGTATVIIDVVAVVAFFRRLHDAIATTLDHASVAAAVTTDAVAVVALLRWLQLAVPAVVLLATGKNVRSTDRSILERNVAPAPRHYQGNEGRRILCEDFIRRAGRPVGQVVIPAIHDRVLRGDNVSIFDTWLWDSLC
jgi:hypothetical protein